MKKVLVLNADFTPFKLVSWRKGLVQVIVDSKESAYPVEYYNKWVILDSGGREYQVPAVIALKHYVDAGNKPAPYTKTNVYARDSMICQYCGNRFKRPELTVDHVIPRSRWKKLSTEGRVSSFTNVVTSCKPCNSRKADRTPQEADMYPINKPRVITRRESFVNRMLLESEIPDEWQPYIAGLISE